MKREMEIIAGSADSDAPSGRIFYRGLDDAQGSGCVPPWNIDGTDSGGILAVYGAGGGFIAVDSGDSAP